MKEMESPNVAVVIVIIKDHSAGVECHTVSQSRRPAPATLWPSYQCCLKCDHRLLAKKKRLFLKRLRQAFFPVLNCVNKTERAKWKWKLAAPPDWYYKYT